MTHPRWVVLSDGSCPTEDIYFLRSVGPWLQTRGAEVRRIDTSYWRLPILCTPWLVGEMRNAHVIVCRSLNTHWLSWLETNRGQMASIRYLIDDDIAAAALDPRLPEGYRRRMAHIAANVQPRLMAICDEIVACSEGLAQRYRESHPNVSVLTPSLIVAPSWRDAGADRQGMPLTVGFFGSRAHLADLETITPALVELHGSHASLTFEIMLGGHSPASLQSLDRVRTPKPMSWRAFQRYRQHQRVDVALTPMVDTPFNAGKSHIKFLDNAITGSVGVYSACSPYRNIVEHGVDGLLVENQPGAWKAAIQRLVERPSEARRMAGNAVRKAIELGDPVRAQTFWWQRR
ncbi:glycosyltransferase family 1 protein [Salinicola aestuarinus]|uniref:glycosyltransferase family 1 protein n=1 Tax=Salinicola aestuarinus TaxID=1949082 RepID=UPI000DA1781B|nr:glycosyltransferase family 1 protein [Salinicola aestuarinus]